MVVAYGYVVLFSVYSAFRKKWLLLQIHLRQSEYPVRQERIMGILLQIFFDFLVKLFPADAKQSGGLAFIALGELEYLFDMLFFHSIQS
jgi:hypothetical protein